MARLGHRAGGADSAGERKGTGLGPPVACQLGYGNGKLGYVGSKLGYVEGKHTYVGSKHG
ncbi:hypothetical protein GCM10027521_15900 [Amycolatopsis cihanbeyliensis]